MNPLDGKAALVTGGGRGIGAAIAVRLAADGADGAITYATRADRAEAVVKEIGTYGRRGLAIRADSADPAAVTAAVDRVAAEFGRLDVLVNNAGDYTIGPIEELTVEQFDRAMAVNVRAPFVAAQSAARHLRAGGRIISIGSNVAVRVPFPGFALYATGKSALDGLTRSLSRELGPRQITVNLVNPGPTDTELNPADGPAAGVVRGFTALDAYADPADIAAAVAFLARPDSRYLTGATVAVDGGFTA